MTYEPFAVGAKSLTDPKELILLQRIKRVEDAFHTHPDQQTLTLKKIHKLIQIWAESAEELYQRQPKVGLPLLAETYSMPHASIMSTKYPGMLKPLRQLKSASREIVNHYRIKDDVKEYLTEMRKSASLDSN